MKKAWLVIVMALIAVLASATIGASGCADRSVLGYRVALILLLVAMAVVTYLTLKEIQ